MVDLIRASGDLRETGAVVSYTGYDAAASLSRTGEESDWMLELPAEIYAADPIACGEYIYVPGTEFGGPCERIRHSTADGSVRLYGPLWRSLLARRIICPAPGETHFVIDSLSGGGMLSALLGDWNSGLVSVSAEQDGFSVSGKIRYRPLLEAAEELLGAAGARLALSFSDGRLELSAQAVRDFSQSIELSDDYLCTLISDTRANVYDHVIALGRGEMLERQVIELWRLPDGTVTSDAALAPQSVSSSLLYDYTFAESLEELEKAARSKLAEYSSASSMEFEFADDVCGLELCDRVCVRDNVTDASALMSVVQKRMTLSESGASLYHKFM